MQSCSAGGWLVCEGEIQSSDEICDGQDNNCDNNTDEGFNIGDQCFNGLGECRTEGVIACVDENQSACNAVAGSASEELCDGLDNDCDDLIDEELEDCCEPGTISECGIDTGECVKGTSTCLADRSWDWCFGATGPSMEECDGKDNDCDGENDNDLIGCCSPGVSRNCGIDEGECRIGTQTCWENREWGACQNQISPTDEICDGLDNNCDGFTDEDFDLTFDTNNCGSCNHICGNQGTASSICEAGECILQCSRFRFDVNADPADGCECEVTNCGVEICDQVDNDCDGAVDEDCQSLVMYLSFDNHFNDGSTNANNAVNHGATFTADAVCGQAASFDGVDDYAEVDSVSMNSIGNEFTFFATVKVRSFELNDRIFNKYLNKPSIGIDFSDNVGNCWNFMLSSNNIGCNKAVAVQTWITIAGKYSNGRFISYVNGEKDVDVNTANMLGTKMYIGASSNSGTKSDMIIDQLVFYNKAFSEEEIVHYFKILK
ncbi:MAG: LamG domain-containing protein [Patescibacteria group bacterium]|nr:LamG domain-containing protein [Patescibacteria group bacterium]